MSPSSCHPETLAVAEPAARTERPHRLAPVTGVVLCGGASRRMGRDKARLELAGASLLRRALDAVGAACDEVLLASGDPARYAELGVAAVADEAPDAGPLAGLAAALASARHERVLVVACDMPRVEPALLRALLDRAQEADLDVCWFESARGLEPLCAVYSRRCLAPMRAALRAGRLKVTGFVTEELRVGRLGEAELDAALAARDCAVNLNTPADLAAERVRWDREGRA
ncbi:MAG: molybdenum cofactor guanylyltransferase [Planctomycetes bacterium]|nr:molybdenum cofactor guanylyltransferase [Planctomycetota bacterium]